MDDRANDNRPESVQCRRDELSTDKGNFATVNNNNHTVCLSNNSHIPRSRPDDKQGNWLEHNYYLLDTGRQNASDEHARLAVLNWNTTPSRKHDDSMQRRIKRRMHTQRRVQHEGAYYGRLNITQVSGN